MHDIAPGMHSHAVQSGWYEGGERAHHATEVGRIVARYIADTASFDRGTARVKAGMASTEASAKSGRTTWANYGKYGVLGVGAIVVGAAKSFANFDRNMNIFQANTDATTKTMAKARAEAKRLGADARFPAVTAATVAEAMVELSKAGLTAKQSIGALDPVMLLGTAGQMDFADAGQIAANAMNAFHLKANKVPALVDDIAGAALKSSSDVKDIAEAFRYTSSAAAGLGAPIGQVTSLIGLLSNLGLKGDMAGTSMRMFFTSIAKPRSNPAASLMRDMGLLVGGKKGTRAGRNLFFNKDGTLKDMKDIFALWKHATRNMNNQQKVAAEHTIFGTRGMNVGRAMDRFGPKGFAKMQRESTKAGLANKLAAANTKGLYGAFQRLINTVQTLGLELGEYLAPYLIQVSNFLNRLAVYIEANQKYVKGFAKAIVYAAIALGVFKAATIAWKIAQIASNAVMMISRGAMILWRTAILAVRAPMALVRLAQWQLNAAMAANPVGIIIIAIVALILILRHFGVGLNDITRIAKVAWTKIKDAFFGALEYVKNWRKHWKVLLIGAIAAPLLITFLLVRKYWAQIKGAFLAVAGWVLTFFKKHWVDALLIAVGGPFGILLVLVKHKIGLVKAVLHSIIDFIIGLGPMAVSAAKSLGSKIIHAIISGVKSAPGALKDAILGMIPGGGIAKHAIGGVFGFAKHAAGGNARGGMLYGGRGYTVGENGPETFYPGTGGYLHPNSNGGGPSVNIEHMSVRSDEDPYIIASVLGRKLRLAQ